MESRRYAASIRRAKKYDRDHGIRTYTPSGARIDYQLKHCVRVVHDDGSRFELHWALAVTDPKDSAFVWVFAEHRGPFVFAKNEIELKSKPMVTGS